MDQVVPIATPRNLALWLSPMWRLTPRREGKCPRPLEAVVPSPWGGCPGPMRGPDRRDLFAEVLNWLAASTAVRQRKSRLPVEGVTPIFTLGGKITRG